MIADVIGLELATMETAPPKPEYSTVSSEQRFRLAALYQVFADENAKAWHLAYGELHKLQSGKGRIKNHPHVFNRVWETYDLTARAVLYLSASVTGRLTRSALCLAADGSHGFSRTEINTEVARFPASMFHYHCDLPMTIGEVYPLRTPRVSGASIECVIEDFAYYFVSAGRGREYCTLHDGKLRLLETKDYGYQLEHDWDGKCEYIY